MRQGLPRTSTNIIIGTIALPTFKKGQKKMEVTGGSCEHEDMCFWGLYSE